MIAALKSACEQPPCELVSNTMFHPSESYQAYVQMDEVDDKYDKPMPWIRNTHLQGVDLEWDDWVKKSDYGRFTPAFASSSGGESLDLGCAEGPLSVSVPPEFCNSCRCQANKIDQTIYGYFSLPFSIWLYHTNTYIHECVCVCNKLNVVTYIWANIPLII